MRAAEALRLLDTAAPELGIRALRPLARGWDAAVFETDTGLIMKVGDDAAIGRSLTMECALLPRLAPALAPISVPTVVCHRARVPKAAHAFTLSTKVGGSPLTRPSTPAAQDALAAALAELCHRLHRIPPAELADVPFDPASRPWRQVVAARALQLEHELFVELDPPRRRRAEELLQRLDAALAAATPPSVLNHGDLTRDNVLVDDRGTITALLDFGDALMGDPAHDLRTLPDELGPDLARGVMQRYAPADDALRHRVALYARLLPLEHALFAKQAGNDDRLREALASFYADPWARL
ncbi:MAG: aminoglycoside phosphotransferase family protein [Deltaproteobacteria bacterium]|nr:aminoglycoside phosphotransferase family protein [Deltaproteobacteria bacterium]